MSNLCGVVLIGVVNTNIRSPLHLALITSSRVNFNISTRITTDDQHKIKDRAIFGSPGVSGSAEVLW